LAGIWPDLSQNQPRQARCSASPRAGCLGPWARVGGIRAAHSPEQERRRRDRHQPGRGAQEKPTADNAWRAVQPHLRRRGLMTQRIRRL
jgi:hypothetical protein